LIFITIESIYSYLLNTITFINFINFSRQNIQPIKNHLPPILELIDLISALVNCFLELFQLLIGRGCSGKAVNVGTVIKYVIIKVHGLFIICDIGDLAQNTINALLLCLVE